MLFSVFQSIIKVIYVSNYGKFECFLSLYRILFSKKLAIMINSRHSIKRCLYFLHNWEISDDKTIFYSKLPFTKMYDFGYCITVYDCINICFAGGFYFKFMFLSWNLLWWFPFKKYILKKVLVKLRANLRCLQFLL